MSDQNGHEPFRQWCVLELFGHRRLAGLVTEQQIGGASFIRLDVPGESGEFTATQLYNPSAVYCMTPTTEAVARQVAKINTPEPVSPWELRPAIEAPRRRRYEDDEDDEDDEQRHDLGY